MHSLSWTASLFCSEKTSIRRSDLLNIRSLAQGQALPSATQGGLNFSWNRLG